MSNGTSEEELRTCWRAEYARPFVGWDFSVFSERRSEIRRHDSWDYTANVLAAMEGARSMLDMDTGGGEKLADLPRRPPLIVATEGYAPNLTLARRRLEPLGVQVLDVRDVSHLPFDTGQFDLVTNRHGAYDAAELLRVLRPDGRFVTQQVGERTNRRLHELLGDPTPAIYPSLVKAVQELKVAGFHILEQREEFPIVRYADVGAVVYYLKAVSWEVPDFSVDRYFDHLLAMHALIEAEGHLDVSFHRFFIITRKPSTR